MDASGVFYNMKYVASIGECEQVCNETAKCQVFTYSRQPNSYGRNGCFLYENAKAGLVQKDGYDTGIRP